MDINKLTQKSQQALAEAQTVATRMGHNEVDGEHLLLALIDQPDGLVPRLLDQAGADTASLRADLERELNRRPKVSGPGAAPGRRIIMPPSRTPYAGARVTPASRGARQGSLSRCGQNVPGSQPRPERTPPPGTLSVT